MSRILPSVPNTRLIGFTYHFRITTPPDLRDRLDSKEIGRSLETSNPTHANRLARGLARNWKRVFAKMRRDKTLVITGADIDGNLKLEWQDKDPRDVPTPIALPSPAPLAGEIYHPTLNQIAALTDVIRELADKVSNLQTSAPKAEPKPSAGIEQKLSKLIPEYLAAHEQEWTDVTKGTNRRHANDLNWLMQIVGDKDINAITRQDFLEYQRILGIWPADFHNSDGNIKDYISKYPEKTKNAISPDTRRRRNDRVIQFLEWCKKQYDKDDKPFLRGEILINRMPLTKKEKIEFSEESGKDAFTFEELVKLFSANTWTKHRVDIKDFQYWCPLILLYTGMRPKELCQLYSDDIQPKNGYHIINVTRNETRGQVIKTNGSRRQIPIHQELVDFGFLKWAKTLPKAQPIFPKFWKDGQGNPAILRDWLHPLMEKAGILSDRLTMYSLRHTFSTNCSNLDIKGEHIDILMGHTNVNVKRADMSTTYQHRDLLDIADKEYLDKFTMRKLIDTCGIKKWRI